MKSKNPKKRILKKGLATCLSAMLLASPMVYATTSLDDSYLQSSWWEQILDGTIGSTVNKIEEHMNSNIGPLYITNETQLRAFAEYVNNGNNCANKTIVLLNDIEVDSNLEWTPIKEFGGTFDGRGHFIKGIKYIREERTYENLISIGFFGRILQGGTVKNLKVKDFNINVIYDEDDINLDEHDSYIRSAGNIAGKCEGTIEYCMNYSDIYGAYNVGGIVGCLASKGKVNNCYNKGNIQAYQRAGGIVGLAYGYIDEDRDPNGNVVEYDNEINNCINEGDVIAEKSVGGIIGLAGNSELASESILIKNCLNKKVVKATNTTNNSVAGIIGKSISENAKIENCTNEGEIVIETATGTGNEMASSGTITIENCKSDDANIEEATVKNILGANASGITPTNSNGNTTGFNSSSVLNNGELIMDIEIPTDDNIAPGVEISVPIENALESGRYTAGKDIIIQLKTTEKIKVVHNRPELEISFSKSGNGKYNSGCAKCIDVRTDLEGNIVWSYVYQIQQFDEGDLQIKYAEGTGKIEDFAGNVTVLGSIYTENLATFSGQGSNWTNEVGVELQFYKNSINEENKVTDITYFTGEDDLVVLATFNRALYAYKYNHTLNGNNYNNEKKIDKNTAPSLYLPNVETAIKADTVNVDTQNKKTVITYKCVDVVNNYEKLTKIEKLKLKNENNTYSINITQNSVTTSNTPGSKNDIQYVANNDVIKNLSADDTKILSIENILIDRQAVSINPDYLVYADTTEPSVTITPVKNITNRSTTLYAIKFSEKIEGFTLDDITVNNGKVDKINIIDVAELFTYIKGGNNANVNSLFDVNGDGELTDDDYYRLYNLVRNANTELYTVSEGEEYFILIKNYITEGTEGEVKVIIEQNAVQDLVGQGNIRQENIVKVDKIKPTLTSYEVKHESEKIIVEAIFSEEISNASELIPELTVGEKPERGVWDEAEIFDNNKAKFTYNISGADGGEVKVTLNGIVKDVAGNNSEAMNVAIDTDIVLEQKVITINGNKYSFSKNTDAITDFSKQTHFKADDKITVTKIDAENNGTTYEYTLTQNLGKNNVHIKTMELTEPAEGETIGTVVFSEVDRSEWINIEEANIWFDTILPGLTGNVYTKNPLESGRYPKATEITIDITTSEKIDENKIIAPEVLVSFSESGIGKYNYNEEKGSGYAIKTSERVNENGSTTWTYTYIVQEFDEGEVIVEYKSGKIVDLAGNEVNIETMNNSGSYTPSATVSGSQWGTGTDEMPLNITYEVYKNSINSNNKVEATTYFTYDDNLYVKVTFDKVLYVFSGTGNSGSYNVRLTNNYKEKAPSLYIGGDSNLKCSVKDITTSNGSTTITYELADIVNKGNFSELTQLNKFVLKNENNSALINISGSTLVTGGIIPFSAEYYQNYNGDGSQTYDKTTIGNGKIKVIDGITNIVLDPLKISDKISDITINNIYADTTAPTVIITANKSNPTNAEIIEYTFEWSEEVDGFGVEDITIIGAEIDNNEDGTPKFNKEENTYTLVVKHSVAAGNEGEVQVIVEQDACKDNVGLGNVRCENKIIVDKKVPEVQIRADKNKVNGQELVKFEFIWNENITKTNADDNGLTINNAEIATENEVIAVYGENAKPFHIGGKYSYVIVKPDGTNDVEVMIGANKYKDAAGNGNIASDKYVIPVMPTVTINANKSNPTNESKITYEFAWSEAVTGFEASDIVLPNGVTGILILKENNTYTMEVDYGTIIPVGNEGEVTVAVKENAVQDSNGNTNANASNTLKIDRIAPIFVSLEAYTELNANVDTVKEYYKVGDEVTIVATFSENISNSNVPKLALQFSESGNANGTIREKGIDGNKITYSYTIDDKDAGTLSVKGFTGKVVDVAGNETIVTKRNLDGDTIIADTIAPKLQELNVITKEGTYKAGNEIVIEARFDEEIYALNNSEVKNISSELAPTLKVKFGNGAEKVADPKGYVGEDKTKLKYTVSIVDGDKGILSITAYENKENAKVVDIAGNEASLNKKQTGNAITADTTKPSIVKITAEVPNPQVKGTWGSENTIKYHKAGDTIKIAVEFNEEVKVSPNSKIAIGFAEEDSQLIYSECAYGLDSIESSKTIEFSYTIKDGDNGLLWVQVPENQFDDVAGNKNQKNEGVIPTKNNIKIYADTINPTFSIENGVELKKDGKNITVTAYYSEYLFAIEGSWRKFATIENAPKIVYKFGNSEQITQKATRIGENRIVYEITQGENQDGEFDYGFLFDGHIYDRAGNEFISNGIDTTAPILEKVEVLSNAPAEYNNRCKAGNEIYVIATFNEPIASQNMKLKIQVGDGIEKELTGIIDEQNSKQVKFTYIVKANDNGEFKVLDVCGNIDNTITNGDNTYGWVKDNQVNINKIFNFADGKIQITGNKLMVDTTAPTIQTIEARVKGTNDIVASYSKESGEYITKRTNADTIEYVITFSENIQKVNDEALDSIKVINADKGDITIDGNKIIVVANTTIETVQSLIVPANIVQDIVENVCADSIRFNAITIDFTKPTVRFISEYNGGVYVLPTNIGKVEIRPNVEISENISKIEYKWDNGKYAEIEEYSSSSDISVPSKTFTQAGTHTLYIRVTDEAGNVTEASKTYEVINSNIEIEVSTTQNTMQNITAIVSFGEGLTDNRRVTFKPEGSNELIELNSIGTNENGTQYTITTNGTIYAEATDKVGNKVFTERPITNIQQVTDTTSPVISSAVPNGKSITITATDSESGIAEYAITKTTEVPVEWSTEATIKVTEDGTFYAWAKDNAGNIAMSKNVVVVDTTAPTITLNSKKSDVTVGEKLEANVVTNENAIIAYSWDNQNWVESEGYISNMTISKDATTAGTYTLYVKAKDNAENEEVKTLEFAATEPEVEEVNPEIIFEDLPIMQIDGVKYVKVSADMTSEDLTNKMNETALCGATPEYIKLTEDNKLRTGSEITINGETKYIIVVNGDVNCDGNVEAIDVTYANRVRLGRIKSNTIQELAADFDLNGEIEALDITMINRYRLGKIKGI